MRRNALAAVLMTLLLSGCSEDVSELAMPVEPGPDSIGYYCRMTLAEHKGPKGQILPRGWSEPLWFSSVRDALTYVEQDIVSDHEISGFWVNDMAMGSWEQPAPGSWIDARTALFVVGSRKDSGMGASEAVPFKERLAAEAFAREFGGEILGYAEARQAMASEPALPEAKSNEGGT